MVSSQCLNVRELEGAKRRFIAELAELKPAESSITLKQGEMAEPQKLGFLSFLLLPRATAPMKTFNRTLDNER